MASKTKTLNVYIHDPDIIESVRSIRLREDLPKRVVVAKLLVEALEARREKGEGGIAKSFKKPEPTQMGRPRKPTKEPEQ